MQLQPGTLVLRGKYRIERLLGEGASAEVYLVALTRGQGQRALKILRRDLPGVGSTKINDYRSRFEREYDLQQQLLGNPRIIQAYDADDEDGSPALVMEYAAGGSLQDELDALTRRGERATPARCAKVLQDIGLGLQAMHERGWVHRDVKPRNVLFERAGGRAKLGDLGVAQTDQTRTRTDGQAWEHPGTPPYCSPEHANGQAYLTPAADVYALGAIGYRMLTGQVLAPGVAGQVPVVIEGPAPEWLTGLIKRMLAWDYRERPQNGGAVAERIGWGLAIEREREAEREVRKTALRGQAEAALESGDFARADSAVDELLQLVPDDPEVLRLERRVSLAIVEEKRRIAAEEAKRSADDRAAKRKADDEADLRQAAVTTARERRTGLQREKDESSISVMSRGTEETSRLRNEEEHRSQRSTEASVTSFKHEEDSAELLRPKSRQREGESSMSPPSAYKTVLSTLIAGIGLFGLAMVCLVSVSRSLPPPVTPPSASREPSRTITAASTRSLATASPTASQPVAAPLTAQQEKGKQVYLGPAGCLACHATKGLSAGAVGPVLDKLATTAEARIKDTAYKGAARTGAEYIRESIVNPSAFVVADCPTGACISDVMPTNYAITLLPSDLTALLDFLGSLR